MQKYRVSEGEYVVLQKFLENSNNSIIFAYLQQKKIDAGARFGDLEDNIFHLVVKAGNHDFLDHLDDFKEAVSEQNKDGYTALHLAVINGDKNLIIKLLKIGADINALDYAGNSPALLAIWYDKIELVKLFINKEANLDIINSSSNSLLSLSLALSDSELFYHLLSAGANPLIKDFYGDNCLYHAFKNNKIEEFRRLLTLGCSPYEINNSASNIYSIAETTNRNDFLTVLHEYRDSCVKITRTEKLNTQFKAEYINIFIETVSHFLITLNHQGKIKSHFFEHYQNAIFSDVFIDELAQKKFNAESLYLFLQECYNQALIKLSDYRKNGLKINSFSFHHSKDIYKNTNDLLMLEFFIEFLQNKIKESSRNLTLPLDTKKNRARISFDEQSSVSSKTSISEDSQYSDFQPNYHYAQRKVIITNDALKRPVNSSTQNIRDSERLLAYKKASPAEGAKHLNNHNRKIQTQRRGAVSRNITEENKNGLDNKKLESSSQKRIKRFSTYFSPTKSSLERIKTITEDNKQLARIQENKAQDNDNKSKSSSEKLSSPKSNKISGKSHARLNRATTLAIIQPKQINEDKEVSSNSPIKLKRSTTFNFNHKKVSPAKEKQDYDYETTSLTKVKKSPRDADNNITKGKRNTFIDFAKPFISLISTNNDEKLDASSHSEQTSNMSSDHSILVRG